MSAPATRTCSGALLVVFGGTDVARKAYLSDVRVLDLVANAWVETPLSAGSAEDEAPHTEEERRQADFNQGRGFY